MVNKINTQQHQTHVQAKQAPMRIDSEHGCTNVSFINNENQAKLATTHSKNDATVFEAIYKYSKGNTIDIKQKNTAKMNGFVYNEFKTSKEPNSAKKLAEYNKLIKEYTNNKSNGGVNITQSEQKDLMEKWTNTYGEAFYD